MAVRRTTRVLLSGALIAWTAAAVPAREAMEFTTTQREHWAWKRPTRPRVPVVKNAAWVRNPIDAFVLAGLEKRGLKPAPPATPEELIRRVSFDLTGLPPTPDEIAAYLADSTPGAYERMVDRYLASPAYGERWARHWLDLARYADSNGYEFDEARPDAWRYRDYVVRSFNEDKPYNRFVMEQIAGDEMAPDDAEARVATGFNLLGPDMTDAADQAARRQNTLNDMTDTTGLVFLGLTVGCARCHNHKYEPISQEDYYRLQSFFAPARFHNDLPAATAEQRRRFEQEASAHASQVRSLQERMREVAGAVEDRLRQQRIEKLSEDVQTAFRTEDSRRTAEQQAIVNRNGRTVEVKPEEVEPLLDDPSRSRFHPLLLEWKALDARKPTPLPRAIGLREDSPDPPHTYILGRGEISNRGEEVEPGFPTILSKAKPAIAPVASAMTSSGRRSTLARWIASPDNPLTARVLVNRVWQHHFGRGIVPTPSDFGVRGDSPTQPELLDWLASSFVAGVNGSTVPAEVNGSMSKRVLGKPGPLTHLPMNSLLPGNAGLGWSLKNLHRLILNSNAYRQSTHASAETLKADPENELFSRMNRVRLEGEAVRDAALAISGRLNRKAGGPGVFPPIPPEARPPSATAWPVTPDASEHTRRSLYIFVRRNLRYPTFEVFDSPDTNASCPRREVTTTAPQALELMNGAEMQTNARALAGRLLSNPTGTASRLDLAYRLAFGRKPSEREASLATAFLEKQSRLLRGRPVDRSRVPVPLPAGMDAAEGTAWTDFCLALLNTNEFVYVD